MRAWHTLPLPFQTPVSNSADAAACLILGRFSLSPFVSCVTQTRSPNLSERIFPPSAVVAAVVALLLPEAAAAELDDGGSATPSLLLLLRIISGSSGGGVDLKRWW